MKLNSKKILHIDEKILVESENYNSIFVWIIPFIVACIISIRFMSWGIGTHPVWFIVLGIMALGVIIYWWLSKFELVITDKRVYGIAAFGKRVDLPIDMVSAVGTSWLWGIDVGTSSGKIHFKLIKNQDEIHSVLSNSLLERQQSKVDVIPDSQQIKSVSNADELKKYKELLDSGVITQEEFDAKKKQLLDL